ncbi:MAG TPA: hypothetical protein VNN80_26795 [Polyangiaceae bacterium]|nr:hypothetical protein [Polyangiaceae bacterium]
MTKQTTRYVIEVPAGVIRGAALARRDSARDGGATRDSDLLFPAVTGGFRARTVLEEPCAAVSEAIELGLRLHQRGMRRTFNDLMRAAQVEAIVTRSISGHLTERMQDDYSTVSGAEQRASIAKVFDLMTPRKRQHAAARGPHLLAGNPRLAPNLGAPLGARETRIGDPVWRTEWCSAYGTWYPKCKKPAQGRLHLHVILTVT